MDTLQSNVGKQNKNFGWIIVFIVAMLQTLTSFFLIFGNNAETFAVDTGIAWAELVAVYPTVAAQYEGAQQASIVGAFFLGLMAMVVTVFALRKGEVWSWFALWLMPLYMLPGTITLTQSDDPEWVAVMAWTYILLAVIGLLVSWPFSNRNRNAVAHDQIGVEGEAG